MAIQYNKKTATFTDTVSVEEAEGLLEWIQKTPKGKVDLAACTHLHAANLQVLMAAGTPVAAWPSDEDFKTWLTSALIN